VPPHRPAQHENNEIHSRSKLNLDKGELKALRKELGLTQGEVATGIGLRRFALSIAENGHLPLRDEELGAYADFLNQRLGEIKKIEIPKVPA